MLTKNLRLTTYNAALQIAEYVNSRDSHMATKADISRALRLDYWAVSNAARYVPELVQLEGGVVTATYPIPSFNTVIAGRRGGSPAPKQRPALRVVADSTEPMTAEQAKESIVAGLKAIKLILEGSDTSEHMYVFNTLTSTIEHAKKFLEKYSGNGNDPAA